jgi:hypothetical protein
MTATIHRLCGTKAAGRRQQIDRFQEARLAGSVVSKNKMSPGTDRTVQGLQVAKISNFEIAEHAERYSRIGMITQT